MTETTNIRLTIGIPTYNFGRFIGQTLDAFIDDLPGGVEILVVDGNSTDETQDIVRLRQATSDAVRFVQLDRRGGIDADVARTMELARGDYVWLFSADDVAMPGAVQQVLARLDAGPDVMIAAHTGCDIDMNVLQARYPITTNGDIDMQVRTADDRHAYLQQARTSEALFSFLSGLIVRKSVWDEAQVPDRYFFGSCWGHAARLLHVMRDRGLHIVVRTTPLLHRRGDNDSFLTSGLVARFALAIDGYDDIFTDIFGAKSRELAECHRVLRNEFKFRVFLMTRLQHAAAGPDWQRLQQLFERIYGTSVLFRPYRLILRRLPLSIIAALIRAKVVVKRLRR